MRLYSEGRNINNTMKQKYTIRKQPESRNYFVEHKGKIIVIAPNKAEARIYAKGLEESNK